MAAGLPPPVVVGIRFAVEPGRGRTAMPARSVLIGTALAVVMVVATVTFGASLHTLVSRPALYLIFCSKEEVFEAVVAQWAEDSLARITAGLAGRSTLV